MTLTHEDDGTTALRGDVGDQAALHGLLAMVRDLGAPLIAVTPLDALDDEGSREQQQRLVTGADDAESEDRCRNTRSTTGRR